MLFAFFELRGKTLIDHLKESASCCLIVELFSILSMGFSSG